MKMNKLRAQLNKGNQEPVVNLTSLTDIAFLLIIFYIMSASFDRLMGQKLEIPKAEAPDPDNPPPKDEGPSVLLRNVEIIVDKDKHLDRNQFKQWLADKNFAARKDDSQKVLILSSQPDVTYERYFDVLNLISAANAIPVLIQEDGPEGGSDSTSAPAK